ncbi:ribonuclease H-like domain-containing protein [Tanacetum coccineum]
MSLYSIHMAQQVVPAAQLVSKYHTIGRCNNYAVLQSIPLLSSMQDCVINKVSAFYTKNLAQPWQTMFKVFNRCLTTRTSRHDQTKINILQLFHAVINRINVDYAALLWWDFMNNKFPNIPQRIEEDYHSIKDDIPLEIYATGEEEEASVGESIHHLKSLKITINNKKVLRVKKKIMTLRNRLELGVKGKSKTCFDDEDNKEKARERSASTVDGPTVTDISGAVLPIRGPSRENGSMQQSCVYVDETFSPVVKPCTIRTVLSLAISRHWPVHQLDVKNAFLHGNLSETQIIASLHQEFSMTDMGSLNYFLGISVTWDSSVMFLSQYKYATEILKKAHMVGCNSSRTSVDTESKQGDDGDLLSDPTLYRSLAVPFSILLLHAMIFLMWSSSYFPPPLHRWLHIRMQISAEVEYRGVANVLAKTCWLRNLLRELRTPLSFAMLVYFNNVNLVAAGQVRVLHVPSRYQYADIFTKSLPSALFEEFHTSLSVYFNGNLVRILKGMILSVGVDGGGGGGGLSSTAIVADFVRMRDFRRRDQPVILSMIFAVNSFDSRFATLAEIIRHREPLPTFETVPNMLLLKESLFNDDSTSTTFESSSSSPTILMASSSSNTKEIHEVEDTCVWSLGTDGTFSVKDARCIIDSKILPSLALLTVWDKNIPRNVNIFIWRLILDRLPHKLNLSAHSMDIQAISCPSCNGNVKSSDHIFFECNISKDIWMLV